MTHGHLRAVGQRRAGGRRKPPRRLRVPDRWWPCVERATIRVPDRHSGRIGDLPVAEADTLGFPERAATPLAGGVIQRRIRTDTEISPTSVRRRVRGRYVRRMECVRIRPYRPGDEHALAHVSFMSVREAGRDDYSEEQVSGVGDRASPSISIRRPRCGRRRRPPRVARVHAPPAAWCPRTTRYGAAACRSRGRAAAGPAAPNGLEPSPGDCLAWGDSSKNPGDFGGMGRSRSSGPSASQACDLRFYQYPPWDSNPEPAD
jgi:hypothetical protein